MRSGRHAGRLNRGVSGVVVVGPNQDLWTLAGIDQRRMGGTGGSRDQAQGCHRETEHHRGRTNSNYRLHLTHLAYLSDHPPRHGGGFTAPSVEKRQGEVVSAE